TVEVAGKITFLDQFEIDSEAGFPVRIRPWGMNPVEFVKTSGDLCFEWLYLESVHASGGANWYAGVQSSDLGGNMGWQFNITTGCEIILPLDAGLPGQAIRMSPNPVQAGATLVLDFELEAPQAVTFTVRDLQGRLVHQEVAHMGTGAQQWRIPTGNLSQGVYMGSLEVEDVRIAHQKVVVQ
ncbi:MAG: T9SS type A sorting domain-containing protein, partial [Bacteroidota bacterium]